MDFYMRPGQFAGQYAVDDYTAAWYLVHQLSSKDEQISAKELKSAALLLRELLQKLKSAIAVSAEALLSLQQAAANIPEIGSLMFSGGNLPGTLATVAGGVMATAKGRKVSDLLDLTDAQKNKLHAWANSRGSAGARSAKKTFRGTIKVVSINGQRFFEVPITAVAQHYKVLGEVGQSVAHVPLGGAKAALNQRAHLHANGATGALKVLGSPAVGGLLAVGPQALLDYSSSSTGVEFYNKSVYSQPTNIASAAAGMIAGSFVGAAAAGIAFSAATLIVVIAVGWIAGVGMQKLIIDTGYDIKIGNALKVEN